MLRKHPIFSRLGYIKRCDARAGASVMANITTSLSSNIPPSAIPTGCLSETASSESIVDLSNVISKLAHESGVRLIPAQPAPGGQGLGLTDRIDFRYSGIWLLILRLSSMTFAALADSADCANAAQH
jgi:hypothetical protein